VQEYIYDLWERSGGMITPPDDHPSAQALRNAVFGELANDLQTPKALAELFTFVNRHPASGADAAEAASVLGFLRELNEIVEVWQFTPRPAQMLDVSAEVQQLAEARWQAKKSKNFAESDRLRGEIAARGFVVKDTKDGFALEKA
jgi:cysteinyl-tRNA synthetase